MKKQLKPILLMAFIGIFLCLNQTTIVGTVYRAEKIKSIREKSFIAPLLLSANEAAYKQQPTADKGVGPIKELKLEAINQKMANDGKAIFNAKCVVCHNLDQKILGPPLRNVTKTRTPEFIMNMLLNPTNMEKQDPITIDLHKKSNMLPMTDQKFTQAQARSVLEYLRTVVK